jgi:cell wall-associated NlpC family hydrolase
MRYRAVAGLAVASLLVTTPAGRDAVASVIHSTRTVSGLQDCTACHSTGSQDQRVVTVARRYLGVPYVWGGETRAGMDCSGFTQRVYRDLGVQLPRTAAEQQHAGTAVHGGIKNARPGDLLFWVYPDGGHHVAIYEGGGRLIEAPQAGVPVSERKVYSGVIAIRRIPIKGEK